MIRRHQDKLCSAFSMFVFLTWHNWFYKEIKRSVMLEYTLCHIRCHLIIYNYKFSNMESFRWVTVLILYQTDSPLKKLIMLFGNFEDWNLNSWKSIQFLPFVLSVSTLACRFHVTCAWVRAEFLAAWTTATGSNTLPK